MSLLSQIAADRLQFRKDRNKAAATTLTTLYGEAAILGKNDGNRESTDDEVMKVVKKFIKGVRDNQTYRPLTDAEINEVALYEQYIPATISEEVITEFASGLLSSLSSSEISMKLMGRTMGALNKAFPDQVDGQIAGPIIKQIIQEKMG